MEIRKYEKIKAHTMYKDSRGIRVPGVSTVKKQLGWSTDALVNWARREALAGNDPQKVSQEAMDIGSLAHFLIENHFKGYESDLSDFTKNQIEKAENCFLAFLEWNSRYELKMLRSELALVSEKHRYGGTLDFIATPTIGNQAGKLFLIDFKSSKGIYADQYIQIAAYFRLWWETQKTIPDETIIVKLGKEDGSFLPYPVSPEKLKTAFAVFTHCRALYDLQKLMK